MRLTLDEYEDVRANPVRFFTTPGHEDSSEAAGAAHVVEERDGYVVVDKIGVAGDVARERYNTLAEGGSSSAELEPGSQSDQSDH